MISASDLESAFPAVPAGIHPLGARVLVQLRSVRSKTNSGLVLARDTRQFNQEMGQFAKVIELGPLAYCNRSTAEPWPEGMWVKAGDIVRVPKYGGDRMIREIPGTDDTTIFCIFDDHVIGSKIDLEVMPSLDELV